MDMDMDMHMRETCQHTHALDERDITLQTGVHIAGSQNEMHARTQSTHLPDRLLYSRPADRLRRAPLLLFQRLVS